MKEEVKKKDSTFCKMTAGLQFDDSDPNKTTCPELAFSLKRQLPDGKNETFNLGLDVIVHVYSNDLAAYLSL
jgi:hypothetical protein